MATTTKDYYNILGVSKTATKEEIKKAYRALARKYHPDLNPGNKEYEEKFKEVQEANEVLSNEEKRKAYDMFGSAEFRPGGRTTWRRAGDAPGGAPGAGGRQYEYTYSGEDFPGFEEIFKDIFGFSGGGEARPGGARSRTEGFRDLFNSARDRSARARDIEHQLEMDFDTAIKGGVRDLSISRGSDMEQITVKIPAGVDNGSRIRVKGKGEASGGAKGDLYLRIKVRPHPIFRRKGDDIYLEVPVSIYEAALGKKIDVPTIDGSAELKLPAGVQNGARLRLKGKGVTNLKTKARGDQYIEIKLVMPDKISEEEKAKFEELEKARSYNPRTKFERYMR